MYFLRNLTKLSFIFEKCTIFEIEVYYKMDHYSTLSL